MTYFYHNSDAFKRWLIWSVLIYACLVFNVLEPFEISMASFIPAYSLILCGHGVVSSLFVWFLERKIEPRISCQTDRWSGVHSFIWIALTVILLSLINWVYVIIIHFTISGWHNIYVPIRDFSYVVPRFLAIYCVWGFIGGLSAFFLFDRKEITPIDPLISLYSDNQNDKFRLKESSILCFKTCDNYLELYYLNDERHVKHRLIRSSMTKMVAQLDSEKFLRCHQSFLVNKDHIQGLSRQKNQTLIELAHLDFPVNVARTKLKQIKLLLNT